MCNRDHTSANWGGNRLIPDRKVHSGQATELVPATGPPTSNDAVARQEAVNGYAPATSHIALPRAGLLGVVGRVLRRVRRLLLVRSSRRGEGRNRRLGG